MERPLKILLVEDDPDDVWVMRNLLGYRSDARFELSQVELLSAAMQRCAEERFDVILLDLSLPDSRGLETFFTMYAQAPEVPIVVLTGSDNQHDALKAVQAGAQDYLVKGRVDDNLLVRSIRYAVERNRRRRAEAQVRDTSEEFRAAGEIQQRLYPARPPEIAGFDIAGALFPAKATAGDYFDYIPMLDSCLGLVLGDVCSHGMGPALLMSETRACLRTLAQTVFDVGEILTRANRLLAADSHDQHFVTLALARLDPQHRTFVYASAGQRGYLMRSDGEVVVLDSTSMPLGVRADTVTPASDPFALHCGDLITFFTDGVVEAESPGRVRYGVARALQAIRTEREKSAHEIIEALHQDVLGFCRGLPLADDMTIVAAKVTQ